MKYKDFFKEDCGGLKPKSKLKDIDPEEKKMGERVEREHTKDEELAKIISSHHLKENPHYYSQLKQAGLADELKEDIIQIGNDDSNISSVDAIKEPTADSVQKQTVPVTTYPEIESDPEKGADMNGCIGSTEGNESQEKTDVDVSAKDPTPTDHVTGGMSAAPANPNILSKSCGQEGNLIPQTDILKAVIPKDISIDIAESKKLLKKMIGENIHIGTKNAFRFARENTSIETDEPYDALQDSYGDWRVYTKSYHGTWKPVTRTMDKEDAISQAKRLNDKYKQQQTIEKEGYGGDPDKDPAYVKGKRWTVASYNNSTPKIKENENTDTTI